MADVLMSGPHEVAGSCPRLPAVTAHRTAHRTVLSNLRCLCIVAGARWAAACPGWPLIWEACGAALLPVQAAARWQWGRLPPRRRPPARAAHQKCARPTACRLECTMASWEGGALKGQRHWQAALCLLIASRPASGTHASAGTCTIRSCPPLHPSHCSGPATHLGVPAHSVGAAPRHQGGSPPCLGLCTHAPAACHELLEVRVLNIRPAALCYCAGQGAVGGGTAQAPRAHRGRWVHARCGKMDSSNMQSQTC